RLADVRRVLALDDALPGLRRIDLVTNYRCPAPVVRRAVRLIEVNRERFRKTVRAGPRASGTLSLAPDPAGGAAAPRRFLGAPLPPGTTRAVLARTNRELMLPLALAVDLELPVSTTATSLLEATGLEPLLSRLRESVGPLLPAVGRLRDATPPAGAASTADDA